MSIMSTGVKIEIICQQIIDKLNNGHLDPEIVHHHLRKIVENKMPPIKILPKWYVLPAEQLEDAKRLNKEKGWGFLDECLDIKIPDIYLGENELLFLAVEFPRKSRIGTVNRTFTEQFKVIRKRMTERGIVFTTWDNIKTDLIHLRYHPKVKPKIGFRWVVLDYAPSEKFSNDYRVFDLWSLGDVNCHPGPEILSAIMFCPDWCLAMNGMDVPFVYLTGYHINWEYDFPNYNNCDDFHKQGVLYLSLIHI